MGTINWAIEWLAKTHDRAAFDCGVTALNNWLRHSASQFDKRDLARTYVAVPPGESVVMGYYAISGHHVRYEALKDEQAQGLPKIDVPVVLLGRLAVDRAVKGRGLGSLLLVDALRRAEHVSKQIGARAVEVDALDPQARAFYLKFGFLELADDPDHLFLPMQVIR